MNAHDPNDPQPFERLNYFNGQRLSASDFRSEQVYLMRVRRFLNRSLYSSGVVTGLEVEKHPNDNHRVVVLPGLAFDHLGREVILLEPAEVVVSGTPSTTPGVVFGNYLVISYAEERSHPVSDGCRVAVQPKPCSGDLAWGAPTRILANPRLQMVDAWPVDESGKVVLAQIELGPNCSVAAINQGVRKYAVPAKPPTVRPISLEGEKDLNATNPKLLYFHIEGGYPTAVSLHLRGARFSTLYYTEMGGHDHAINLQSSQVNRNLTHTHTVSGATTQPAGEHTHSFWLDDGETSGGLDVNEPGGVQIQGSNPIIEAGEHTHDIEGIQAADALGPWSHHHNVVGASASSGVNNMAARSGATEAALTYVDNLQVACDGIDITPAVLQQLAGRDPANWGGQQLGDGTQNHVLVQTGTGAIELHRIVNDLGPGPHVLELRVGGGGGKIHFNLYVE